MKRILTALFLLLAGSLSLRAQIVPTGTPGWRKISYSQFQGGENTNSCPSPVPPPAGDDTVGCVSMIVSWNGGIVDTSRNRLLLWGGGHNDYGGNEAYSLDLTQVGLCSSSNPCIKRLDFYTAPNPNSGQCYDGLPVGGPIVAPNARHQYDGAVYVPSADVMFVVAGSLNDCGFGQGNDTPSGQYGTWALSMSSVPQSCAVVGSTLTGCTASWTKLNYPVFNASYQSYMSAYDSVHNVVWENTQSSLMYFPFNGTWQTNSWVVTSSSVNTNIYGTGIYDDYDQYFINVGTDNASTGKGISYFNVSSLSPPNPVYPGVDSSCAAAVVAYPGLAWDPIARLAVIYPGTGNTLYLLDPKTWKCTTESYGSTQGTDYPQNTVASACDNSGTCVFKRFAYYPGLDVFVLLNDYQNDAWYLRRRRANMQIKH